MIPLNAYRIRHIGWRYAAWASVLCSLTGTGTSTFTQNSKVASTANPWSPDVLKGDISNFIQSGGNEYALEVPGPNFGSIFGSSSCTIKYLAVIFGMRAQANMHGASSV